MNELLEHVKAAKFPYWTEAIHLFVGGSALHGAKVSGYDDLDIYGVYVEPPEKILGVDAYEHFVWSTSGHDRKNDADDIDITLYGLRKWANLVECEELMRTGEITLPSPERDLLIGIRNGEHTEEWVIRNATERFESCKAAEATSPLRPQIDRNLISKVIADAYRRHWASRYRL